jgi:cation:H+ antiporter
VFSELLFGNENIETHHLLIELVLGGLIVIVTGSKLTRNADEISDALNLGKAWIGLLLLATVTSLPELVTGLTAVTLETPNANLAFGNILGSNSFNVAIIVVLNTVLRKGSVLREARPATTLAASFGVVMTGMLLLAFAIENKFANEANFVAGFETVYCVLIFATYIFVMRLLYRFEKRSAEPAPEDESAKPKSMGRLYTGTAITAVLIVAAGYWMTRTGDKLADHPIGLLGGATLGGTFVGAFFLAIATSLPEIVTGIAAVRMGQLDLALGNVFGSNMFNVFVVPFLKLASAVGGKGLIMGGGSDGNAFDFARNTMTGALAILLMGIAIASVTYQSQRRIYFFGFDSVLIGLVYFGGMFMLIMAGS